MGPDVLLRSARNLGLDKRAASAVVGERIKRLDQILTRDLTVHLHREGGFERQLLDEQPEANAFREGRVGRW